MHKWLERLAFHAVVAAIALSASALCAEATDSALRPDVRFVLPAAQFEPLSQNDPFADESGSAGGNGPLPPPTSPAPIPPQQPPMPPSDGVTPDGHIPDRFDQPRERYEYEIEPHHSSPIVSPCDCDVQTGVIEDAAGARAVQYPDDWMWGCGGFAYQTGPGLCDDWKVGCRWETSVDGLILFREDANLSALQDAVAPVFDNPIIRDQFDWAPGGRVSFVGKYPKWMGFEVQAAYEGIEEWNASLVAPKIPANPVGPEFRSEQSSLFYRSSLHSAELNILQKCNPTTRAFCGIRYIKFDDEINYAIDEQVQPPLPDGMDVEATDQLMINDVENNLIGFQIGGRHDLWHPVRRFTLEGFINAGVYYNHIKRTDVMTVTTTEFVAEVTTPMMETPAETNVVSVSNRVVSEPSEVATVCEASLTGVCRLNKCWAVRAGYQVLWIEGVALAEDAFLNRDVETRSLLFHGLHMGVECRR